MCVDLWRLRFARWSSFEVQEEMRLRFRDNEAFEDQRELHDWMSTENTPTGIPTEREVATKAKGEDVYRAVFHRR